MSSFETAPEAVMLPVDEVVNLHNLVMGGIRQQQILRGRKVKYEVFPREYRFCMLDLHNDMPADNTGSVDTYLSVRLAKPRSRYWSMLVSFLEGKNTVADANSNARTVYRMDWTPKAALGITWSTDIVATSDSSALIKQIPKEMIDVSLPVGSSVRRQAPVQYMFPDDIFSIRSRVSEISEAVMFTDQVQDLNGYLEPSFRQ
jgi:hypothetical protein